MVEKCLFSDCFVQLNLGLYPIFDWGTWFCLVLG